MDLLILFIVLVFIWSFWFAKDGVIKCSKLYFMRFSLFILSFDCLTIDSSKFEMEKPFSWDLSEPTGA